MTPPFPSWFRAHFRPGSYLSPKNPDRESSSVGGLCRDSVGDNPQQAGGGAGALGRRGELKKKTAPAPPSSEGVFFVG